MSWNTSQSGAKKAGFWSQPSGGEVQQSCGSPAPQCGASVSCVSVQPLDCGNSQAAPSPINSQISQNAQPVCGSFCDQQPTSSGSYVNLPNVNCIVPGYTIPHKPRKFEHEEICIPPQTIQVAPHEEIVPARTWRVTLEIRTPEYKIQGTPSCVTWPGAKVKPPCHHHCEPDCVVPPREICIKLPALSSNSNFALAGQASVVNSRPVEKPCQGQSW